MSKYNEQHATTMLNTLIGTDTLTEHDKEIVINTIDECISKIDKLMIYYAGDKEGNPITPKLVAEIEDAILEKKS